MSTPLTTFIIKNPRLTKSNSKDDINKKRSEAYIPILIAQSIKAHDNTSNNKSSSVWLAQESNGVHLSETG